MKLSEILNKVTTKRIHGDTEKTVGSMRYDSRHIHNNDVFFAWKGDKHDGHAFIEEACKRGAKTIVLENAKFVQEKKDVTFVEVKDARRMLSLMASLRLKNPSRDMGCAAVTGTNGKTTVAFLTKHLLEDAAEWKVGLVGTVECILGDRTLPSQRTTPEGSDLQEMLSEMKKSGCNSAVIEVSSHSLVQGRVAGMEFEVGVFTNLTQDHLDYHKSMEEYFEAKLRLFKEFMGTTKSGVAVLNKNDKWCSKILKHLPPSLRVITFSPKNDNKADLWVEDFHADIKGIRFNAKNKAGEHARVRLPLIGAFNVENAIAAMGVGMAFGVELPSMVSSFDTITPVPGRMECVGRVSEISVVIDYAHTEDAVKNVLKSLRDLSPKKLIVVIGCGGNRDKAKRPAMARVATSLADHAIFTSDNPRNEDPKKILEEMVEGVKRRGNWEVCEDRREAIQRAIDLGEPGSIVCVAGKGHETTQEIGDTIHVFDDRVVAKEIMETKGEIEPVWETWQEEII